MPRGKVDDEQCQENAEKLCKDSEIRIEQFPYPVRPQKEHLLAELKRRNPQTNRGKNSSVGSILQDLMKLPRGESSTSKATKRKLDMDTGGTGSVLICAVLCWCRTCHFLANAPSLALSDGHHQRR